MATTEESMWPKPRPGFTTVLAGLLSLLLGLAWFAGGVIIIVASAVGIGKNQVQDIFGELGDALLAAFIFVGVGIAFVAFLVILFSFKVFRRRSWARWFLFIFFLVFFLTTLFAVVGGGQVDTSELDATYGYIGGLVYTGLLGLVALLLVLPPTSRDFRRVKEWQYPAPAPAPTPAVPQPPVGETPPS